MSCQHAARTFSHTCPIESMLTSFGNSKQPTPKQQERNNPNQKSYQIQSLKCVYNSYAATPTQKELRFFATIQRLKQFSSISARAFPRPSKQNQKQTKTNTNQPAMKRSCSLTLLQPIFAGIVASITHIDPKTKNPISITTLILKILNHVYVKTKFSRFSAHIFDGCRNWGTRITFVT